MAARVTIRPVLILAVTAPHAAAASQSSLALTQADVRAVPPMLLIGDAVGSDEKDCSVKDPSGNKVVPNPTEGFAEFRFRRPAQGPAFVTVDAEVYCPDSLADSFWMQFDEGGKVRLLMGTKKVFTWIQLFTSAPAPYSSFNNYCFPLPADGGEHTLRYFVREPGAQLRRANISSPPTPEFDTTNTCPAQGCDMSGSRIQIGVSGYCGPVALPETRVTVHGKPCGNLTLSSDQNGVSLSCDTPSSGGAHEAEVVVSVFGEVVHIAVIRMRAAETGSGDTWIWILVGVGGFLVLVVPPVIWKFTANWRQMRRLYNSNVIAQSCAESIAKMRFEEVEYIREIERPSPLQRSFIEIIDTLREYKAFLPEALFAADEDTDEGVTPGNPAIGKLASWNSSRRAPTDMPGSPMSSTPQSPHSQFTVSVAGSRLGKGPRKAQACAVAFVDLSLVHKQVSVLWFGINKFHAVFAQDGVPYHSKILDAALQRLTAERGVCDHISGDRVVGTFGAAKSVDSQKIRAAVCAVQMGEQAKGMTPHGVHVGTDCGTCKVGTLGCTTLRKHSTIGNVMNNAYLAARMARFHQVDCIATERIVDETHNRVQYHAICCTMSEKFVRQGAFTLYEALDVKVQAMDEWMYQLEEDEKLDPHKRFNAEVRAAASKVTGHATKQPLGREQLLQALTDNLPMDSIPLEAAF
eukprot:TRINITY_DN2104_c0_g3_i1.p1 TRINITY_DN2104_c0_g3~~TRINITY_DN2104_c0_g3_i1.p1  ORF type:complete len:718 (+),score=202.19 TRINITY_DN2104_c0_g3_i1:85-2154(+)